MYGRYRGDLQPIGTVLSLDCPQLCLNLFHPVAEVGEVIRGDVQRAYAEAQRYLVDHRRLLFCRQIPILEFSVQLYLYIPYIPYRYSCTGFQYLTIFRVMRCPPVTTHPFFVLTLHNHTSIESARSGHYNGVWYVFRGAHSVPMCSSTVHSQ